MAKKIVGIYKITCIKNEKIYVGQSIDINRRFNQHKRKEKNPYLKADMEKFGLDAFKFEIIEECAENELNKKETEYINQLQPEYNIKTEGQGISEEAREKLRELHTGKKRTEISRRVKCVETGEVFDSITAAAQWCKVPSTTIVMLLKGKGRTAGGYHWIYADDENEEAALERISQMPEGLQHTEESKEKQRQIMSGRKHTKDHCEKIRQSHIGKAWKPSTYEKCCRKILCVETGEIFSSIKAAAEHYGLNAPNLRNAAEKVGVSTAAISHSLHGRAKTAGGYHWEFVTT